MRGDDALKIMKAAGHTNVATTMGYVRDAEQVSADFGEVFPPLPSRLLSAGSTPANRSSNRSRRKNKSKKPCIYRAFWGDPSGN